LRPGGTPAAHASGHAHSALDPEQLAFARRLRRTQTHPEAILWALLRSRHLGGCKFRRQHPAPPYVLDFYCHQARLAIEVDGDSHDVPDRQAHDEARTRDLRSRGIRVLRFANADVLDETEGVLEAILRAVREPTEPTRGAEADATPPQPLASGPGWHEPSVSRPIAKWDLFHYVYAVLHHPSYRERFAEVLKKELPRVPLLPEFPRLVAAGRALAALHVHHDAAPPYDPDGGLLRWTGEPPSWRVEAMRLAKDHATLAVNPSLTLGPIPPEAFAYRLGNRSALEWVIDQYRVDPAAGEDPNRPDDPEHVVRHVQRVLSVSLATVRVVASLPEAFG
jgi:very-short-patch-repair endonuclease